MPEIENILCILISLAIGYSPMKCRANLILLLMTILQIIKNMELSIFPTLGYTSLDAFNCSQHNVIGAKLSRNSNPISLFPQKEDEV